MYICTLKLAYIFFTAKFPLLFCEFKFELANALVKEFLVKPKDLCRWLDLEQCILENKEKQTLNKVAQSAYLLQRWTSQFDDHPSATPSLLERLQNCFSRLEIKARIKELR